MVFRMTRLVLILCAAGSLFFSGWACSKFANKSGVSDSQVVATIGDKQITFSDWMHQMDLLRVFSPQPVDPNNSEAVRAVLESLIDQEVVLEAARSAHYTDPKFDELSKNKLLEAGNQIKDIKDRLVQDMETVKRLEKTYKNSYLQMLLAQSYAASRIDRVAVSDQQIKDRYAKYVKQMAEEGQKAPPLDKVKDQVRLRVRADNLMNELQGDRKVVKNEDVIKKYLDNLSTSSALLQSQSDLGQPSSAPPASKPGKE
jgi:DNA-binding TFAR19-related protein (PDSD5 family)